MKVTFDLTQREADELMRAEFKKTTYHDQSSPRIPRDLESAWDKLHRAIIEAEAS